MDFTLTSVSGNTATGAITGTVFDQSQAVMRSVKITLSASDFVSEEGDEMRSFVATGSLGRVAAAIVSSSPKDLVRSLVAAPEISRFSPLYGEELKGIESISPLLVASRSPWNCLSIDMRPSGAPSPLSSVGCGVNLTSKGPAA